MIELVRDDERQVTGSVFQDYPNPNYGTSSVCKIRESVLKATPTVLLGRNGFLMRLDQSLAADLWPLLKHFAETGRFPEPLTIPDPAPPAGDSRK